MNPRDARRGPSPPRLGRGLARVALLLVMLGGLAPTAHAAASGVHSVLFDRVEDVAPGDFTFTPCDDSATFVPLDDGFRFEERQAGSGTTGDPPYPGGYLAIGCGEASVPRHVPAGTPLVEVSFRGDRGVQEFNVEGNSVARPGREFAQEVAFRTASGVGERRVQYMDPNERSLPEQLVILDAFQVPEATQNITLAWSFRDASYFVGPTFPDVLSGQSFSATVRDVQVRYRDLSIQHTVSDHLEREGRLLVRQTRVHVMVAEAGAGDVHLDLGPGLAFSALRAPDGTTLTQSTNRFAAGPDGYDHGAVLVEQGLDGATRVTVPREMLAAHGAGGYTLSFTSVGAVHTFPWLLPLAILVLLAPLPFALLAYHHVRRFEDEAFGGFRRSARNLRVALIVAFAYYVAVVLSHFLGSRFELMAAWPLPLEAILVYVQVVIAVAAFLALYAVARELYHITVPKPLPLGSTPAHSFPEDPE
jgi:hypothetical protein